jgi:hypothetical protein
MWCGEEHGGATPRSPQRRRDEIIDVVRKGGRIRRTSPLRQLETMSRALGGRVF